MRQVKRHAAKLSKLKASTSGNHGDLRRDAASSAKGRFRVLDPYDAGTAVESDKISDLISLRTEKKKC